MPYPYQPNGAGLPLAQPTNHMWPTAQSQMPPEHQMSQGHLPMPMGNPNLHILPPRMFGQQPPLDAYVTNVRYPVAFPPHSGEMPFVQPPLQGPPQTCPPYGYDGTLALQPPGAMPNYSQPPASNDWSPVTQVPPGNQQGNFSAHRPYSHDTYRHQVVAERQSQFRSEDNFSKTFPSSDSVWTSSDQFVDTPHQRWSPMSSSFSSEAGDHMVDRYRAHSRQHRRGDQKRDSLARRSRSPDSSRDSWLDRPRESRSDIRTRESSYDMTRESRPDVKARLGIPRESSHERENRSDVIRERRHVAARESSSVVARESRYSVNRESRSVVSKESRYGLTRESRSAVSKESRYGHTRESRSAVTRESRSAVTRDDRSWKDSCSSRSLKETDMDR